jgi:hypothetical protein
MNLIPEGTWVFPPPNVVLCTGLVKHLPQIRAEGCPPLPEMRTLAPAVPPLQLDLGNVATCDWIKKDYIM